MANSAVLSQSYLKHANVTMDSHEDDGSRLEVLTAAADLATLEMSVSELAGLQFELQELRHSSVAAPADSSDQPKPIDQALNAVNEKLETVTTESQQLKTRLDALAPNEKANLSDKHERIQVQIQRAQAEADNFHEELKEDKWLTVFRTVASQADDMMNSLDKILAACHDFVWDVNRSDSSVKPGRQRQGSVSTATASSDSLVRSGVLAMRDPESVQATLQTYISLHRSLHAKRKYYEPSTARVLDILGKGIAERSTKNGEVLRKYSDLKSRHRKLQDRIVQIQREMDSVEELLKDSSTSTSDGSPSASNATPPKEVTLASKMLSYSPLGRSSPSTFKRFTNRLSTNMSAPPVPPLPSGFQTGHGEATIRERKSGPSSKRISNIFISPPTNPRSVSSPAVTGSGMAKPKWNTSLQRDAKAEGASERGTPSKSQGVSSNLSSYSYSTPPSRSLSPSLADSPLLRPTYPASERPISPSGLSSISGLSLGAPSTAAGDRIRESPKAKARPSSPRSKIPAPASSQIRRFRSSTPFGMPGEDSDDESAPPMLPRALSPTPSNSRLTSSLPVSMTPPNRIRSRKSSHNPEEQEVLAPPPSANGSRRMSYGRPTSRQSSSGIRSSILTPEPDIRARASRINSMARPSLSNKKSTSAFGISKPRPSATPTLGRSAMLSPTIMLDDQSLPSAYKPNPVDILDIEIATTVNAQPLCVQVERVDLPLNKFAAQAQKAEDRQARYYFGSSAKPVMCKLVERKKGTEVIRKVLCKTGASWQDLELLLLDLQANMY